MDKQVLTKEISLLSSNIWSCWSTLKQGDDGRPLSLTVIVRTVGEQLSQQFGVSLARMARTIREKNERERQWGFLHLLTISKTLSSVINSFFGTNQLSQFMDQTNPQQRSRISSFRSRTGGLSREEQDLRFVTFTTHYGRLYSIESFQGPNIGLISSLAVFAKVNSRIHWNSLPYG
jgi:DNA-directed RNA polymerase subunit beta